jgi:exodeoxyribonuclease V beta subunit
MNDGPAVPFDISADIPDGTLAIEASAGTGKTFTLAALATKLIAEYDLSAAELLIVTFTRAATNELRSRVRQALVAAADHLRNDRDGSGTADALLTHLYETTPAERQQRLARLERAVTEFDAATITTIHGFAQQVLGTLGADAGVDRDAVLVDDLEDLLEQVCADVLAAAAVGGHPAAALPDLKTLIEATDIRLNRLDVVLEPATPDTGADDKWLVLVSLINRCVDTIADRRRRTGTMSFGDVLLHLQAALDGPGRAAAVRTLHHRYRAALIDEFQDTDPVQWAIFSTLFGEGAPKSRLVLVGDPKQAIYAFRGTNIHTFAAAVAPRPGLARRSLETNWRSDDAMLGSLNVLFGGATFGEPQIAYATVAAAAANRDKRLRDDSGAPFPSLSLRLAMGDDIGRSANRPHAFKVEEVERAVYGDLAEQVVALLDHGRLPVPADEHGDGDRPVRPSDIAVLVRTGVEAEAIRRQLRQRNVPAILARGPSVLESPAGEQWRWLLEALLRPSDPRRARAYALSWFRGMDPAAVAELDDDGLGLLQDQLQTWAETLRTRGVSEWVRQVWTDSGIAARVLGAHDGERLVTDLGHIAELFRHAAPHDHLSVAGLLATLGREPTGDADLNVDGHLTARRVESDEQAVQIMTVWVAKGLQFPIVCCPTLWHQRRGQHVYQDPVSGRRTFDVSGGAAWPDEAAGAERKALAEHETLGEDLRLLYVALTRAVHHAIVWWSRTPESHRSGLAHVLFARRHGEIDEAAYTVRDVVLPDDADTLAELQPTLARSGGTMVAAVHGRSAATTSWHRPGEPTAHPTLALARLTRRPDRSRHRWSFTAVTHRLETDRFDPYDESLSDRGASDEQPAEGVAGESGLSDDPAPQHPVPPPWSGSGGTDAAGHPSSPLTGLPAGAAFGTLVHSVLEQVDFAADDLDTQLATALDHELSWRPVDLAPVDGEGSPATGRSLLLAGLRTAIETPLGPLAPGARLRDVTTADRLNELSFEFRLGESGAHAVVTDIGRLVLEHLGAADLLRPWAERLAEGELGLELAGHLTGSIDAVVRTGGASPRFIVIDYKSNRLSPRGAVLGPDDYARPALATSMAAHHYPLQALLYAVALHRYLRWRLVDYDPARHLGGIAYLYVRGMGGPGGRVREGHPDGVFSWAVPPTLVSELSDLLDGCAPTAASR